MEPLVSWSRFLQRQAQSPPLVFRAGMRHSLEAGDRCAMHTHGAIEIVYHPAGRGVTRLARGGAMRFAEGGVVVYAPGEAHDQAQETAGEDFCVQLLVPRGRRGVPRRGFQLPVLEEASALEDIRLLSRGHVRLGRAEQALFNLRATSVLHALVHLARARREEDAGAGARWYVAQAERHIREHFGTLRSLREVADAVGVSPDHLRHAFKALRGRSLVAHLNEVRLERARALLAHSPLPLKQVASRCGFADPYYFSAVFRKAAGLPPGRYRRRMK